MSSRFGLQRFVVPVGRIPVVLAVLVAGIGVGAFGYAGFAQTGGVITACINNGNGHLRYSTEGCRNNETYIEWNEAGPQGIQGEIGPTGPQGPQGVQGPAGNDGQQGPQGDQGLKGDKGDPGADGLDGSDGATGPAGQQGEPGADGVSGWQVIDTNFESINASGQTSVVAVCTGDRHVLGGGHNIIGLSSGVEVIKSQPFGQSKRSWLVTIANTSGNSGGSIQVYAICAEVNT